MDKSKIGKIDISALNVPPEKYEYETARYFANRGYDVVFVRLCDRGILMAFITQILKCAIKFGRRKVQTVKVNAHLKIISDRQQNNLSI